MKIIRLTASNIKRLVAVEITPAGNVVEITGKNMQGKSSVLDSIWYALGGKKAQPAQPIRRGQDTAEVFLDLGEYRVTRRWTKQGSSLKVTNADGLRFDNPQKVLDALVGNLSFDPTAFVRMKPADQVVTLKQVAGLDFTEIDNARQLAYDQRRDHNRDIKQLEANVGPEIDAPDVFVSVTDLGAELTAAHEHNNNNDSARQSHTKTEQVIVMLESRIQEAKTQLTELQAEHRKELATRASQESAIEALIDIDTAELAEKIANAEVVNVKVRDRKQRAEIIGRLTGLQKSSDRCAADINRCDTEKHNQLENAALPIDGLSFDDNGVTFNELPFNQASSAEQLRVSVAMGLAINPKLKVMLVRDGSLMDEQSLALLSELAEKNDAQVWLETVGNGEGGGVVIEDGSVVESEVSGER